MSRTAPRPHVPYPQRLDEFADLDAVIRDSVLHGYPAEDLLSDPQAVVVTQGSCFASNVAASLARLGTRVAHLNVNEYVNTTIANALFFDHAFGGEACDPAVRRIFEGVVQAGSLEEFRELVAGCRAFILTIGVAPCWFVRGTGQLVLQPDKRHMAGYEMRTTSPGWNAENIRRIVAAIRRVNPATRIFLTLSPAPLNWSFEFPSTIVGDCLSKSVLRVAIHEVMSAAPEGVRYWPSFEVVRWVGSHLGPVFGGDDGEPRHVSSFVVDAIVRSFIRVHGGDPDRPGAAADFDNHAPFTLARNFPRG